MCSVLPLSSRSSAPRRPIPPPAAAPAHPAGQPGGPIPPVDPAWLSTNSRSPRPSSPATAGPPTTWARSRAEQPAPPNIPPPPHPETPHAPPGGTNPPPALREPRPFLAPRARGETSTPGPAKEQICRRTAPTNTSTRHLHNPGRNGDLRLRGQTVGGPGRRPRHPVAVHQPGNQPDGKGRCEGSATNPTQVSDGQTDHMRELRKTDAPRRHPR